MAELLLKGLLLFHDIQLKKIHDLLELKTLVLSAEPGIEKLQDDLVMLNRYYIEDRYPGDYPEIVWFEAEQALAAAIRIKEFVLSKIN